MKVCEWLEVTILYIFWPLVIHNVIHKIAPCYSCVIHNCDPLLFTMSFIICHFQIFPWIRPKNPSKLVIFVVHKIVILFVIHNVIHNCWIVIFSAITNDQKVIVWHFYDLFSNFVTFSAIMNDINNRMPFPLHKQSSF